MKKKSRSTKTKEKIGERDGVGCWICGAASKISRLTIDHVIPRAHGGTSAMANLKLACKRCNSIRGCGCQGFCQYRILPEPELVIVVIKPEREVLEP